MGNLPWSTANGDYSNTGLSSRLDAVRPLNEGETDAEFVASEIDANHTLAYFILNYPLIVSFSFLKTRMRIFIGKTNT